MNALVLKESEIESDIFIIEKNDSLRRDEQIKHILQSAPAQQENILRAAVLNQGIVQVKVELSSKGEKIKGRVLWETLAAKQNKNIHVYCALCRPQAMEKIIENGTALGLRSFNFFACHLSEKSYASSKLFSPREIEKVLFKGLAQSAVYSTLPSVNLFENFPTELPADSLSFLFSLRQCFFTVTPNLAKSWSLRASNKILIFGPERGLTLKEEEKFEELGANRMGLGDSSLRVEAAFQYGLGYLEGIFEQRAE